jgi:hypothetical protein
LRGFRLIHVFGDSAVEAVIVERALSVVKSRQVRFMALDGGLANSDTRVVSVVDGRCEPVQDVGGND